MSGCKRVITPKDDKYGDQCNIETYDQQGNTGLHYGAMTNSIDIVKFCIITGKCNVDSINSWGTTACMYASKRRRGDRPTE